MRNQLLVACLLSLAACADGESIVRLNVVASSEVVDVDRLRVSARVVDSQKTSRPADVPAKVMSGAFGDQLIPLVLPSSIRGQVQILVDALGPAPESRVIASGDTTVLVSPSQTVDATVSLGSGSGGDGGCGGPELCAAAAVACGQVADRCGGTFNCGDCALRAAHPAIANTDDEITLEGAFGPSPIVNFPGGVTVTPTALGPNRLAVRVPAAATAGDLTVSSAGTPSNPLAFRRASFTLGFQPTRMQYPQTEAARSYPSFSSARQAFTAFHTGKYLYLLGGQDPNSAATNTVERALTNRDGTLNVFYPVASGLGSPRRGHTATQVGNRVYVVGGFNTTSLATIERAVIQPDGTLSAFVIEPTVRLATAREQHATVVVGSRLYVIGGNNNGENLNTVETAPINPDGSLGSFAELPQKLTVARSGATVLVVGKFLYVIGGATPAGYEGVVERAEILGDGTLGMFTRTTTSLQIPRAHHVGVRLGATYYVIGGTNGSSLPTVEKASISASGDLGTFVVTSVQLLDSRIYSASTIVDNNLYLIGGRGSVSFEYTSINGSGEIGSFSMSSSTNRSSFFASTAVIGDNLYVFCTNGGSNDCDVERAPIGADYSLGAFVKAGSFPAQVSSAVAVYGQYVFLMGGVDAGTNTVDKVLRAPISEDGTVGMFSTTTPKLPSGREGHTIFRNDDFSIAVVGGLDTAATSAPFLGQPITNGPNADGSLNAWASVSGSYLRYHPQVLALNSTTNGAVFFGGRDGVNTAAGFPTDIAKSNRSLSSIASTGSTLDVGRSLGFAFVAGPFVYFGGGKASDVTGASSSVSRATLDATGAPGNFQRVSSLTIPAQCSASKAVVVGNAVYFTGCGGAMLRASLQ